MNIRTASSLLVIFSAMSCSFPNYSFDNATQTTGVDFTSGKWLLNEIEASNDVTDKLTQNATNDFKAILGSRLSYLPETSGMLLSQKIDLNPDAKRIKELAEGTGYDYFINIKANKVRNDFSAVDLTPASFNNGGQNINNITLEVYDLKNIMTIYSQTVTATVGRPKDNQDVHLSKPSTNLIYSAYRKLFNDLKSKSVLPPTKK